MARELSTFARTADWLESHWVTPAYAGWLLGGIAICFFAAATNTMAGWLYAISGTIVALLVLAAVLPARSLKSLQVRRHPITPISAGDRLTLELDIKNPTTKPKTLLQVRDNLPPSLGELVQTPIEVIPPQESYHWTYYHPAPKRGIYQWQDVQLRTATPLGLFWCRRSWQVGATAIVYPQILPLNRCPLVDEVGQRESAQLQSHRHAHNAQENLTRGLRPYRVGDPTRLIHWRTSARLGELQVRELEAFTGAQEIIIALDSGMPWDAENFEAAVTAAASLYFYACNRQLNAKLWTAKTGLLYGRQVVLQALAATQAGEEAEAGNPPNLPLIWLSTNPTSLDTLPPGSRWLLWLPAPFLGATKFARSGIAIDPEQSLQLQLQRSPQ